jgi:predicted nucleic acid-binding protein
MIVVADTSPINYLVLIEAIDILPKMFREVGIPRAVYDELLTLIRLEESAPG